MSEIKLQKMLVVKSKLAKPASRTKKAYRDAAKVLTPFEQMDLVFGLWAANEELEISSCSEMNSSMEIIAYQDIKDALLAEHDEKNAFDSEPDGDVL